MQSEWKCYAYGEKGHFANQCPNPHTHPQIAAPTPTCGANSVPVAPKKNYARGRVNHIVVEEAQEAPYVAIGMFFC
jgi:hypothetical protein